MTSCGIRMGIVLILCSTCAAWLPRAAGAGDPSAPKPAPTDGAVERKSCEEAKHKLAAGLLAEAEPLFRQSLTATSKSETVACAAEGLRAVARRYEENGTALERAGLLLAAEAAYEAAIKACATCVEPNRRLQILRHDRYLKRLDMMVLIGKEDDAKKALLAYMDADAAFAPRAQRFQFIDRPHVPLWDELRKARLSSAGALLADVPRNVMQMPLTEFLILALVLGLIGRKYAWGASPIDIGRFSPSDEPDEKKDATEGGDRYFTAELEHQLIDISTASRGARRMQTVSGPITSLKIDLGAIPAAAGVLGKLLQLLPDLLARRTVKVSGLLLDRADQGRGVAIQIQSGNRVLAKHTLWARSYGQDADWRDLTICAAVWSLFKLRQHPVQWLAKWGSSARTILGTRDWEAYAWFALGNQWLQGDALARAEAAFLNALSLDPRLVASRVNLAGVYHRQSDQAAQRGLHEQALQLLKEALAQLERVEVQERRQRVEADDPAPYTGLFRRAAVCFDLACVTQDPAYVRQASAFAERLRQRMRAQSPRNSELKRYLDWRLPVVECMALGLKVAALPDTAEADADDEAALQCLVAGGLMERVDFYSLYNVACTYALFAAQAHSPDRRDRYFEESMRLLARCLTNTGHIEVLGVEAAPTVAARIRRAQCDAAFAAFRDDDRFLRVLAQTYSVAPPRAAGQGG